MPTPETTNRFQALAEWLDDFVICCPVPWRGQREDNVSMALSINNALRRGDLRVMEPGALAVTIEGSREAGAV